MKPEIMTGDVIEACGFAPKRAFSSRLERTDRVITARLLLTPHGPEVHWSHYGPLESCISEEELKALTR